MLLIPAHSWLGAADPCSTWTIRPILAVLTRLGHSPDGTRPRPIYCARGPHEIAYLTAWMFVVSAAARRNSSAGISGEVAPWLRPAYVHPTHCSHCLSRRC